MKNLLPFSLARRILTKPKSHQTGVSVVELMVGIAIGLVLVGFVMQNFASSSANANVNSLVGENETNSRYALEVLKREIRHAAHRPLVWAPATINKTPSVEAINYGCGAGISTNLAQGINASNDANLYVGSCLQDGSADRQYLRGDVLELRRTALDALNTPTFDLGAPYARLTYGIGNVFLGQTDTPVDIPGISMDFRLNHDVYYVNAFTNSSSEVPLVPALYKLSIPTGTSPTMVPQLVASNIEHFQVQFGVATDEVGSMRYVNANVVTDWNSVRSARIWLLVRSAKPEPGFKSGKYVLGDVTYEPNDNYRRSLVSSTVNLRNL